jgi:hypothetical protein
MSPFIDSLRRYFELSHCQRGLCWVCTKRLLEFRVIVLQNRQRVRPPWMGRYIVPRLSLGNSEMITTGD